MLSEKKIHKIGRIDQVVRDYFDAHPAQKEVTAKDLMALFIKKGIFKKDDCEGKPIRDLLRGLGQPINYPAALFKSGLQNSKP